MAYRPTITSCAARIFDWTADLRLRQQPGHGDGWLAGCYSRSSTCWFAGYSAWPSWYSVRTWRRMLNCWCSGTRTRFCSATSAGSGTSQQTGCGSPRWHGSSPAGAGPKSSRLRPRRCWPGTANWRGESTTRAGGEARPSASSPGHRPPGRSAGEGESAMGTPPDPRRTGETRHHRGAVHRVADPACRGHRSCAASRRPDVAAVPGSPGRRDPRGRLPARGHRAAEATVCPGVHRAWHPPDAPRRRHRTPPANGQSSKPATSL